MQALVRAGVFPLAVDVSVAGARVEVVVLYAKQDCTTVFGLCFVSDRERGRVKRKSKSTSKRVRQRELEKERERERAAAEW